MKGSQRKGSLFLCMVLFVAMTLVAVGCNDTPKDTLSDTATTQEGTSVTEQVLGEGNTKFTFTVADKEGNETVFEIYTDQETVGEALTELELIDGEQSAYGLYVKTVNGITADYDKDGVYWAFYINDEYASTGCDSTTIVETDCYAFRLQ